MSVTFWCPDAPTVRVQPYEDEPDYFEDQSTLPEVNLANANARAALEMLGLPENEDLCGTVYVHEMDAVLQRLRAFLAVPEERAALLEPTTVNGHVVTSQGEPLTTSLGELLARKLALAGDGDDMPDGQPSRAAVMDTLNPPNQTAWGLLQDSHCKGPRMVNCGRTDEYLQDKARRFIDLFTQAQENNYSVSWG